jgi:MYXO-CTERM domain-containing protein
LGVAALWSLILGCGREPGPLADYGWMGKPIYYGDPDTDPDHRAVVFIQMDLGGGYGAACTGTLISPDLVLTAAHCVCRQGSTTTLSTSALDVGFGTRCVSQWDCNMDWYGVSEVIRHPGYDPDWYYGAPRNDIALIRLTGRAPANIAPIPPLPASLAITQSDRNASLDYSGFGVTESGSMGVLLHVVNGLDTICTNASGCNVSGGGIAAPNTLCSDQSPGGPCSGDSGGPAFLSRSGQEYVVGVTSYGDQNCTTFGCSTKVDAFESFINAELGGANGTACSSGGQCDSGYCVDGVCCVSACAGVCQACNVAGQLGACRTVGDGTPCADADPCNGTETCQAGSCVAGAPPTCDDRSPCTADTCLAGTGCVFSPYVDGTDCSDGDVCNGLETCHAGACRSDGWLSCDDSNPCTIEACDALTGCINTPIEDGLACDLGQCGSGVCLAGTCSSGEVALCDDADACTADWCEPELGCLHDLQPDGYACGECAMCMGGICTDAPDCGGQGCGCAAAGDRSLAWGWLSLLALFWMAAIRRRR